MDLSVAPWRLLLSLRVSFVLVFHRLSLALLQVIFGPGSMGFTLMKDGLSRAMVTRLAPGGMAFRLGVRTGKFQRRLASPRRDIGQPSDAAVCRLIARRRRS